MTDKKITPAADDFAEPVVEDGGTPLPPPAEEENEVLRETRAARELGKTAEGRHRFGWKTAAAAAGIGSAALAAALLYANRNKS